MNIQTDYSDSFKLNSVKLSKEDLLKLKNVLIDDPKKTELIIYVKYNYSNFSVNSFEDLFKIPTLPNVIKDMSIHIQYNDDNEYKRGMWIFFSNSSVSCNINSSDETWLLGKKEQIKEFIKGRKPWYNSLRKFLFFLPPLMFSPTLIYIVLLIIEKEYYLTILPTLFLFVLLTFGILSLDNKIFPFTKIEINKSKKAFNLKSKETLSIMIALLSFTLTLIQLIVTLF